MKRPAAEEPAQGGDSAAADHDRASSPLPTAARWRSAPTRTLTSGAAAEAKGTPASAVDSKAQLRADLTSSANQAFRGSRYEQALDLYSEAISAGGEAAGVAAV